jgi:hypothetical protein
MAAPAPACHCVVPFVPWYYPGRKSFCPYQGPRAGRAKRLPQGRRKGLSYDESYLPYRGTQQLASFAFHCRSAPAIIIFVIDTFTPLNIAIAVLYVIVVLMAANFLRRRGVILVSLACAGLTVLSFILQHDWDTSDSIGRNLVSLTAIGVTAILALNRQRAEDAWRRSETYLTEAQRLSRTGSFSWKIATEEQVWFIICSSA